ncbi:MAG: endopeptidase IV [Legionella sp.]|nr:endopeptidase IV [Legionella sp.]
MNNILRSCFGFGLSIFLTQACYAAKQPTVPQKKLLLTEEKLNKEETRPPIGCQPVGYDMGLKVLSLYPGQQSALQSLYFVYNQLHENVNLYQMRDKYSELSTRYNHTIRGKSWAAVATGEPTVRFICAMGEGKNGYGKIVDCAQSLKVCQYVNVKFGLNNKGNFWIVDSNTRNGAVNDVVHYGVIPGV